MRRWLLVLLLLCAPLGSAVAQGASDLPVALTAEAVGAFEVALSEAAPGQSEPAMASPGLESDPCHAHGGALQSPQAAIPVGRGVPPRATPWRPSDARLARPERPNWRSARHGAPRLPA